MLDADLKTQLAAYLEKLQQPIELVASLDDSDAARELDTLLGEIAALSPKISRATGDDARKPSFLIRRIGTTIEVGFAAIPLGHEFTSLVLALLQVGGHPVRIDDALAAQVRALPGEYSFQTYMSLHCQSCPDTIQALNAMSVLNPRIRHVAIDGGLFQAEVEAREILSVPTIYLNDQPFDAGRMSIEQVLAKLDTGAAARTAEALKDTAPYEVLVVGGGPAGAAAAIYAARKGIRTGILTERFGGQVLDTMAIENFPSVEYTEGPKLAASLEAHVRSYGVELVTSQRAKALHPATEDGGFVGIELESGATLRARTVVLAPGARWRQTGVPGEAEYRNRGVTYCPHCDGPLFKGKRVAVIGGGNSGVEAAIDLAGLVEHVTLLEFDGKLRADDVLQRKLYSLPNASVHVNAQTTAFTGDGSKLQALEYTDRGTGVAHRIDVAGVFVQIGLLPNSEWLKDTVLLTPRGEIVIDDRGHTNLAGVFAAGDATTEPFKQIVVAMGAGSTAALSAFDHLIRHSAPLADSEAAAA
ncbi:alkyl hydroperoxide reductase subunit F [Thermomonas carbonis]|uniref:Alkyl hydroperoxide reductase subunit F n=1 Tax=Thermomonas carbonis TaxID=1463158 RepID=A0A7G9SUT3_9GAMM|nr:alkyl hydroperoxide reductase subunit F [Thermomonas carbonis]QNN71608.1 alkyl hydroperoxide reductase subunit F [Thermomonas carbonis]GHC08305.1 alkyl hydroperoxide reductase subunit F [Thermomonas carbonis]